MIQSGNIRTKIDTHPETRGWFMGNFFQKSDFFHSEHIELKWHEYHAWQEYIGSTTSEYRKTLLILISWKLQCFFGENDESTILLESLGDFVADDEIPGHHRVYALEPSVVLAIRERFTP